MLDTYRRLLVQINATHLYGDSYDPYEFEREPLSEAIHKFPIGALLVSPYNHIQVLEFNDRYQSHTLPKWLYNFIVFHFPFDNKLRDLHKSADSLAEVSDYDYLFHVAKNSFLTL